TRRSVELPAQRRVCSRGVSLPQQRFCALLRTKTLCCPASPYLVKENSRPSPATAAGSCSTHQQRIVEQFTRWTDAFATALALTSADTLNLLVQMSNAGPRDTALDVACGAGLVVCAFA